VRARRSSKATGFEIFAVARHGRGSFNPASVRCAHARVRGFVLQRDLTEPSRFPNRSQNDSTWQTEGSASREEAAKAGGMERLTLRDWVILFNAKGPDGLINIPSPGTPAKLDTHKAFLARIVDEGPLPAIHGVVRWRACDLIMRLHEEFPLSVSDDKAPRTIAGFGDSALAERTSAGLVPR